MWFPPSQCEGSCTGPRTISSFHPCDPTRASATIPLGVLIPPIQYVLFSISLGFSSKPDYRALAAKAPRRNADSRSHRIESNARRAPVSAGDFGLFGRSPRASLRSFSNGCAGGPGSGGDVLFRPRAEGFAGPNFVNGQHERSLCLSVQAAHRSGRLCARSTAFVSAL